MNLIRTHPAVPSDKDFVSGEKLRKEITHFVGCIAVEIHIVDAADVISVKSSHGYLILVVYRAGTRPFEIFINFLEMIFLRIGGT